MVEWQNGHRIRKYNKTKNLKSTKQQTNDITSTAQKDEKKKRENL